MTDLSVSVHDSIEDVNRNQWNNVVEQSRLGSVFHRYEWLQSIERGTDRVPRHVVVSKNGNPIGLFPNTIGAVDVPSFSTTAELLPSDRIPDWLSDLSFSTEGSSEVPLKRMTSTSPGFGGPVILTEESDCLTLMFRTLSEICERPVVYHTIDAKELGYMRYGKALAKRGYEPTLLNCRFELDLGLEFETLLERMDKERRKALLDARADDHRVTELAFDDAVSSTYELYRADMERVDGEVYPPAFFEEIATRMADRVKLFSAEVDGIEVGRYLYLLDDEQSTVHYYFSAIGDSSRFEYHPTELLHAHAIEWGQANGYRYYDFGGTGSTFLDGSFKYKEKYGGQVIPTLTWEKGYSPVLWKAYKVGRRGYQKVVYDA